MKQPLSERVWSTLLEQNSSHSSLQILVAFSGGLDSTVLLHTLAADARKHDARVRAIHVDHQLHAQSADWERHCATVAQTLGVEFESRRVRIADRPEEGIESAARRARYEALCEALRPDEILVTAHHADDQLETVLLALMRGSGVDGLAAMPRVQRFGIGWHIRPLLECTRDEIESWATAHALQWIDDPSNVNSRFDRNYLRGEVMPRLRTRWPSAAHSAVRTASHLGEAAKLLEGLAQEDLAGAAVARCLKVEALRMLAPARRRNLLRYWLASQGVRAPSTRKLAVLEHDMLMASEERSPCVDWDDVEVRRHRGLLYCGPKLSVCRDRIERWPWATEVLERASGLLRAEIAHGQGLARGRLASELQIRSRKGGEVLRLPGHAHRRPLKKLLQEADVLPWWREHVPLIFSGDDLVAVADLWINADFAASREEEGVRIVWEHRPAIEAVVADRSTT